MSGGEKNKSIMLASGVNDIQVNDPSLQQNQTDHFVKGCILKIQSKE